MRWRLVAAVAAGVLAGGLGAFLVPPWWQSRIEAGRNVAVGTGGHVSYYPSVAFVADRLACRPTFDGGPLTPGGISAGSCALEAPAAGAEDAGPWPAGGVRIDICVGGSSADALACLAAHRGSSKDAAAAGGNWAVAIGGTHDPVLVDRILASLP